MSRWKAHKFGSTNTQPAQAVKAQVSGITAAHLACRGSPRRQASCRLTAPSRLCAASAPGARPTRPGGPSHSQACPCTRLARGAAWTGSQAPTASPEHMHVELINSLTSQHMYNTFNIQQCPVTTAHQNPLAAIERPAGQGVTTSCPFQTVQCQSTK